jgi:hypothetical protein
VAIAAMDLLMRVYLVVYDIICSSSQSDAELKDEG